MPNTKTNLVVKTNWLNTALQSLTKTEIRMIQLAIVDARETNTGLDTVTPLRLDATRYAELFGGTRQAGYDAMKRAEKTLFDRRFTFTRPESDKPTKSRWLQEVTYLDGEGAIELVFTKAVVEGISRIDGVEQFFTSYLLEQTADLNSVYAIRLYELLAQWKAAKKTPEFELEKFRAQMGIGVNEYASMSNFKSRVLDKACKEINANTDLKVSYSQVKKGVRIVGFKFTVLSKPKLKPKQDDPKLDNADLFTPENLTDKQLWRITRHKQFISRFGHLATQTAGSDFKQWSNFFIDKIKKEPHLFNASIKGQVIPLGWYLDRPDAEYQF